MISNIKWSKDSQDRLVWVGDEQSEHTVNFGHRVMNKEDQM